MIARPLITLTFTALLALSACDNKPAAPTAQPPKIAGELWKEFSGERAMEHVRRQVEYGPRPSGTAALERARAHIAGALFECGWDVERQEFEVTPVPGQGALKFVNIIARFGKPAPRDTQRAILASHYDTKRMLGVTFVGANDGGSSTGALLEFARVAATAPDFARQMELVFFDGEEAVQEYGEPDSGPDGLIGSRHYARTLRDAGRAKQFRLAVVWDMIGDKDLRLTLPSDTPPALAGSLITSAEALGTARHVGYHGGQIMDDHVPLARIARIPAMDMIDLDYGPWHTSGDTLEQLRPASLEIIGRMTLHFLQRELAK